MPVTANTVQTYDNSLIREDLAQAYSMISPEQCPFQEAIGVGEACTQTYKEWSIVELQAPNGSNRVAEGENAPGVDAPTLGNRVGNYTQISDKLVVTSHTSNAVDAAADNIQREAKQIMLKLKELKRDKEVMLMQNIAANPGSSGTARAAAGLGAWLRTNVILGAGGALPTLSGTDEGYPNAVLTPGTAVAITEANLRNLIRECWEAGAQPNIVMVNGNNKQVISETFTGNATRYKDSIDKTLTHAIDVYDSDFGEVSIVPNRFQPTMAANNYSAFILDPEYAEVCYLETVRQKPLAETGHAKQRLIWCEYTLKISNEAAHGALHATTGAAPST